MHSTINDDVICNGIPHRLSYFWTATTWFPRCSPHIDSSTALRLPWPPSTMTCYWLPTVDKFPPSANLIWRPLLTSWIMTCCCFIWSVSMVFAVSFCDGSSPTCPADHIESSMSTRRPWPVKSTPWLKISDWIGLSSVLRPHQHSIGYMGDGFYRSGLQTQPTVSKYWRNK